LTAELTLTGVAHGGETVARDGDLVTFVSLGLPGERVLADIVDRKPRFQRGRVRQVLEAASERITPPCDVFGTCGGCHWQHAAYASQLEYKTAVLRDQLERTGRFEAPPVESAIASPLEWHYRNRVQLVPIAGSRLVGFRRAHSHYPVPVEHCYISDPRINELIVEAPWSAMRDQRWSEIAEIDVRVAPGQAPVVRYIEHGDTAGGSDEDSQPAGGRSSGASRGSRGPRGVSGATRVTGTKNRSARVSPDARTLTYSLHGFELDVPPDAFFQINLAVAELLIDQVLEWLAPASGDIVIDGYAGVGTFSLPIAATGAAVVAIESHRPAADANGANAGAAGLVNVGAQAEAVEKALAKMERADLILVDPPRRGCGPDVMREIARLHPKRVVYVSCEPSTLARDLRQLGDSGYRLARTRVADMFPQTYHLESVSLLEAT
jgi:23S rRNA (uracil1939-C5)-methyltransferase